MIPTEAAVKSVNPRLRRIRRVVRIAQTLVVLGMLAIVLTVLVMLAAVLGWAAPPTTFFLPGATGEQYKSMTEIPPLVIGLLIFQAGLCFAGSLLLYRLLRAFSCRDYFCAANIRRGHWLGLLVLIGWLVGKLIEASTCRTFAIGMSDLTQLTLGLLIILLAWILDEGRKIQEEQELTV